MRLLPYVIGSLLISNLTLAVDEPVAPTQEVATLKALGPAEALASCQAIAETLVTPEAVRNNDTQVLRSSADQCQELVSSAYQMVRKMGSDYMVGGLSFSVGSHFNMYRGKVGKLSNDVTLEAFGGGTAFLRVNPSTEGSGLNLSLAPLFGLTVTPLQVSLSEKRPLLVEPFSGLIVFVGRNHPKSINDFNGWYGAAEVKFPDPTHSDLQQRSAFAVRPMKNLGKDSYALFVYSSRTGGRDYNSLALQTVYIDNMDVKKSGEGITVDTIVNDLIQDSKEVSSLVVEKALQWITSGEDTVVQFIDAMDKKVTTYLAQ